jgi:hypothetical protein
MKQENTEFKTIPHFQSWVLLWAFAESAVGGVMHAVKFPFTGIIVGSVAVICIAMIGHYNAQKPEKILQALGIVLLIKLTLSPYSPWQAYVAVFFQGYLGYFLFSQPTFFKLKTLIFSTVCLAESAIQKALISIVVYGSSLIEAIDQSARHILFSMGFHTDTSFFYGVFTLYVGFYAVAGILLGLWIPRIPQYLHSMRDQLDDMTRVVPAPWPQRKTLFRKGALTIAVFIFILVCVKWLLPDFPVFQLLWFLLRSILVSLILVFVLGPVVMNLVRKWISKNPVDHALFTEVVHQIPVFTQKALSLFYQINPQYSWWNKIRFYIIGLIFLSMNENQQK